MLLLPGTENAITDERVKQFYQLTEGHIEKINRQMVDFFSYKLTKPSRHTKLARHVGIAAGIFLAASGIVYIGLSPDFQPAPAQLVGLKMQSIADVQIDPALSSGIPAYTVAAARQTLQATSLRRVGLAVKDEEDNTLDESLVVMDKVVVAPKILQHQANKHSAAIKKTTQPAAKTSPKRITKAVLIKPVIEQNRYTIQLLASHNVGQLKQFAQIHHFNGKTQVRRTLRQGTVWYVLTLGEYTQHQQAKQAANHLPKDVAQFNPWVRLIADLKATG